MRNRPLCSEPRIVFIFRNAKITEAGVPFSDQTQGRIEFCPLRRRSVGVFCVAKICCPTQNKHQTWTCGAKVPKMRGRTASGAVKTQTGQTMNIRPYLDKFPTLPESAYVDPAAVVIGDVVLGADSSLWPMVVARGDVNYIRIGSRTNIQDGAVLHVTHDHAEVPGGHPCVIGDDVTVGHKAMLHGCTIGDRCLVGMSAIVLDGAVLEPEVLLGAGSLVPPGKTLEGGYLWLGAPVKRIRPLTEAERAKFLYSAQHYIRLKNRYLGA